MDYYIKIDCREVPVTEEVYKTWCQGERKEKYFLEGDIHNGTISYDALDTADLNGCDLFSYPAQLSVEQQVERRLMADNLYGAVKTLDTEEKELIKRLYCYEESLRQVAVSQNIPVTTLQYRHKKILKKMKNSFVHSPFSSDK